MSDDEAGSVASEERPPSVSEDGDQAEEAPARRGRGRPRVDPQDRAPRKSRAKVRRVVPCYVDMGTFTTRHHVRYDAGQQLYDLTDVLKVAYNGKLATVNKKIALLKKAGAFKPSGALWIAENWQAGTDVDSVKWSDEEEARAVGRGRRACSHRAVATLLRKSAGPRAPPVLGALACWITQNDPDSQAFLQTIGGPAAAPALTNGQQ